MKYSKIVGAVAVGALALGLAACSNTSSDSSSGGKATITWAVLNGTTVADKVIAAFEKKYPNIKVTATSTNTDTYQTLMRTQLSAGTAPDILSVFPGAGSAMSMLTLAKAGLLMDVSNQPLAKNVPSGFKSVATYKGKTYIAVSESTAIGVAYNVTAMKAAGLTAPTTWSELLKFCDDAKAQGKSAFANAVATTWNTQLIPYALTPALVYGSHPNFVADMAAGKATFADSGWKTAFEKYVQMRKEGCFQDGDLGTVYENALADVAKGTSLASVQIAPSIAAMQKDAPAGTEFNLLPMPANDKPSSTRMAVAAGASNGVNAKTKHSAAALTFLNYLGSNAGQDVYATADSASPATPNEGFTVPSYLTTTMKYAAEGKIDPFMDQLWPNPKIQQVHITGLQTMLAGTLSPSDLLAQMDAAYKQG